MFKYIKYNLFKKPLELKKTHDYCKSGKPELAVVFIHGIASDSQAFGRALAYLEGTASLNKIRFVTFDLLGSGKSYKSKTLSYDYKEQLEALDTAIRKLKLNKTPLVLVGHSMGTLIATRYASTHKRLVKQLILLSPPLYTEKDLDNPAFEIAMQGFKTAVSVKNRAVLKDKAFNDSIKEIVKNRKNYKTLAEITIPTTLIYGEGDQIIAAFNIPKLLKENKEYITAIKTPGRHGVSKEKYGKVRDILEETLNA